MPAILDYNMEDIQITEVTQILSLNSDRPIRNGLIQLR